MRLIRSTISSFGVLLLCVAAQSACAETSGKTDPVGDWSNIVINEKGPTAPGCRAMVVTRRAYSLVRGDNSEVHGTYSRNVGLFHLGNWNAGCASFQVKANDFRIDTWSISGSIADDGTITLHGVAPDCQGLCTDAIATADQFNSKILMRNGILLDVANGDPAQLLRFVSADVRDTDQVSASQAFPTLIAPLLRKDCNAFYSGSLDQVARWSAKPDLYCGVLGSISDLLATAVSSMPVLTFRMSLGVFIPPGPMVASDGDVIVVRRFALDAVGTSMELGAFMRRQPDGGWRITNLIL